MQHAGNAGTVALPAAPLAICAAGLKFAPHAIARRSANAAKPAPGKRIATKTSRFAAGIRISSIWIFGTLLAQVIVHGEGHCLKRFGAGGSSAL